MKRFLQLHTINFWLSNQCIGLLYLNSIILQLYYDAVDSGFPSPFTYSINTTDEGYDEHRYPMEISNVIGYNNSAELKTG